MNELVDERGGRIAVIRTAWQTLVHETNQTKNVRGLEEELRDQPGTGYPPQAVKAMLEVVRVRRKHTAKLPKGTDDLQKCWDKWAVFMEQARELRLEGLNFIDFSRHQHPADRRVTLSNRWGAVELTFPQWRTLLERFLAERWQPRGTNATWEEPWPSCWGGWYDVPGPAGAAVAINAEEGRVLSQLLHGAVLNAVLADPGMTRCGEDLDRLLKLRGVLQHDSTALSFN